MHFWIAGSATAAVYLFTKTYKSSLPLREGMLINLWGLDFHLVLILWLQVKKKKRWCSVSAFVHTKHSFKLSKGVTFLSSMIKKLSFCFCHYSDITMKTFVSFDVYHEWIQQGWRPWHENYSICLTVGWWGGVQTCIRVSMICYEAAMG